jgi:ubiquinone/menaquinone biosynthesis C-methylase UbiE
VKRSNFLARQGRQPSGLVGHIVGRIMARETEAANRIALERLALAPADRLLEVGCGHGRTLAAAAETVTRGRLAGIDPSDVMLQIAHGANASLLRAGRMELTLGSTHHLPFADGEFNKLLTVHTIYFWPSPQQDLAELFRVLEPGGGIVIGFRPSEDPGFARDFPAAVYHIRSIAEVERLVSAAGFSDLDTLSRPMGAGLMAWTTANKAKA